MKVKVINRSTNALPEYATEFSAGLDVRANNDELIVVDDGSKDDSASIAETQIQNQWGNGTKAKLIRQSNSGVSTARNNGVAASHGDYICFLDADDWWEPTFLEEMAKLIAEYPDAGIYGTSYTIINERKHKTRVAPIGIDTTFKQGYINYCQVYAKTLCMPLWTGAVCVPRHIFDEMGGFKPQLKLGEDFDLWIRIALKYKVAFLNKPLSNYNQDVDTANRGIGHLHKPENHMLWNLDYLANEEQTNPDYKYLIDRLRTTSLLPYFISKEHHNAATKELAKVNWDKQPSKYTKLYQKPLWYLWIRQTILQFASKIKQLLLMVGSINSTLQ